MFRLSLLLLATASLLQAQTSSIFYLSTLEDEGLPIRNGLPICAAAMPDGGYFVCYLTERFRHHHNPTMGVMRITANGSVDWSRRIDLDHDLSWRAESGWGDLISGLYPSSVTTTADGNYLVTASEFSWEGGFMAGLTLLTFSPHGELLTIRSHADVIQGTVWIHQPIESGSIAIVNSTDDSRLIRFDDQGNIADQRWVKSQDNGRIANLRGLAIDSSNGFLVVGDYASYADSLSPKTSTIVVRIDSTGTVINDREFTINSWAQIIDIEAISDGRYLVVGLTEYGDFVSHPFHMVLSSSLEVDESANNRVYRNLGAFEDGIQRLSDGTLMASTSGWYDRTSNSWVAGTGYVHFSADGEILDARLLGKIPIVSGVNDLTEWSDFEDGDTTNPPPGGHLICEFASSALASDGLFFGYDEQGVAIYFFFAPNGIVSCIENDIPLDSLRLVVESSSAGIESVTAPNRSFNEAKIMGLMTMEQKSVLLPYCTGSFLQSKRMSQLTTQSDFAIEPTRNVIRRGEQIELDIHIERSDETTFAITLAHAATGEISAEQRSGFAAPFHEPVYVPTTGLAPGMYMVVLKVGDREVGTKVQIVP